MIYTPDTWPSDRWPNFTHGEMACRHTGECDIDPDFVDLLQALRESVGHPLRITSGYRHPTHPVEARKDRPGAHTYGKAADISCIGKTAHEIARLAFSYGCTGIGVSQVGDNRFLHIDTLQPDETHIVRPALWSYK